MEKYIFQDSKNGAGITINVTLDDKTSRATGNIKITSGKEILVNGFTGVLGDNNSFSATGKNGNFLINVSGAKEGDYLKLDADFVFPTGATSEKTYFMQRASASATPPAVAGQSQLPATTPPATPPAEIVGQEGEVEVEEDEEGFFDGVKNKTMGAWEWMKNNKEKIGVGLLGATVLGVGAKVGAKQLRKRRKK
jgi:hypothetical protein